MPQFDFDKEVADGRKANGELRKQFNIDAKLKLPGE